MNKITCSPDTNLTLESMATPVHAYSKSIFTSHLLQTRNNKPLEIQKFQPDWILGIFLFGFILLAWTNFFYFNRMKQIILAPLSKRFINQLIRDGNLFKERISVTLATIYILSFSLLLYQIDQLILKLPLWNIRGILIYLSIVGSLIVFWLVKIGLIRLLGTIFKTSGTTHYYLLNLLVFSIIDGLVLLPLLVGIVYLKSIFLLYITLIFCIFLFLFRFLRGFFIGLTLTKFSYLFLFVYLCSLEILPLLMVIKLFMMTSQIVRA